MCRLGGNGSQDEPVQRFLVDWSISSPKHTNRPQRLSDVAVHPSCSSTYYRFAIRQLRFIWSAVPSEPAPVSHVDQRSPRTPETIPVGSKVQRVPCFVTPCVRKCR